MIKDDTSNKIQDDGNRISELGYIEVSDSQFLGFVQRVRNSSDAILFQEQLKLKYPEAAHIPLAWYIRKTSSVIPNGGISSNVREDDDDESSCLDDGEPPDSAGPMLLEQLKKHSSNNTDTIGSRKGDDGLALAVVRIFGGKLLGVTCGRLSQCYTSISRLALHRFNNPDTPLQLEFINKEDCSSPLFGLGSGDTELIIDVIPDDMKKDLFHKVMKELEWGGYKGNRGEVLPRLQNMQANITENFIPVYRYPGNYRGDEWETYQWGESSLFIRDAVQQKLLPLVNQKMNHCVANLYRNGDDFIDHHSDKDLDLNKDGVIVSFSLGDERIMELRRRKEPKDVTRIILPSFSMLVLGPKTNKHFTHSILKKKESKLPRISLTLRHCTTFMHRKSGRLFGDGAECKSVSEVQLRSRMESCLFVLGYSFLASSTIISQQNNLSYKKTGLLLTGTLALSSFVFTHVRNYYIQWNEERKARDFFSRNSATGLKY